MFLVVWTIDHGLNGTNGNRQLADHWTTHEDYADAEQWFEQLVNQDDVWSVTIAQPVKSTEPQYLGEWGEVHGP